MSSPLPERFLQRPVGPYTAHERLTAAWGPESRAARDTHTEKTDLQIVPEQTTSTLACESPVVVDRCTNLRDSELAPDQDSSILNVEHGEVVDKRTDSTDSTDSEFNKSASSGAAAEKGKCVECVCEVPVLSSDDIYIGAHIAFPGALYAHHAIVVGKNDNKLTLVEVTNSTIGASSNFLSGRSVGTVQKSERVFDFEHERVVIMYHSKTVFTCEEIANRAIGFYEQPDFVAKFKYSVWNRNCEHFAMLCVLGEEHSYQVSRLSTLKKINNRMNIEKSRSDTGIDIAKKENTLLFENNLICENCFKRNQDLLEMDQRYIENSSDVHKADIIVYKMNGRCHSAVVLDILKVKAKFVVVRIVHYRRKWYRLNRRIIEEKLKIPFGEGYAVIDYRPPKYSVYPPDEVVARARKRLGEQLYAYFSNDSNHFCRWCKLTHTKDTTSTTIAMPSSKSQLDTIME